MLHIHVVMAVVTTTHIVMPAVTISHIVTPAATSLLPYLRTSNDILANCSTHLYLLYLIPILHVCTYLHTCLQYFERNILFIDPFPLEFFAPPPPLHPKNIVVLFLQSLATNEALFRSHSMRKELGHIAFYRSNG